MMSEEYRRGLMSLNPFADASIFIRKTNIDKEQVMKEINIDGKKYRLVEEEKPKGVLDEARFSLVKSPKGMELMYDKWHIIRINNNGTLFFHASIPHNIGFDVDSDGEIDVG